MTKKTPSTRRGFLGIYPGLLWLGIGWVLVGGYGVVANFAPHVVLGLGVIFVLVSVTRSFMGGLPRGSFVSVVSAEGRSAASASASASKRTQLLDVPAKVKLSAERAKSECAKDTERSKVGNSTVDLPWAEFGQRTSALIEEVKLAISTVKGRNATPHTEQNEVLSRLITLEQMARRLEMVALNAAIEAARAKEHGSGFSIVAKEVRVIAEKLRAQITFSMSVATAARREDSEGELTSQILSATLDGLNGLKVECEKNGRVGRVGAPSMLETAVKRSTQLNERALKQSGRVVLLGSSLAKEQTKRVFLKPKAVDSERKLPEVQRGRAVTNMARPRTPNPTPTTFKTKNLEAAKSENVNFEGGRDAEDSQFERF